MVDEHASFTEGLTSPADDFVLITPNDSVPVSPQPRAIIIGAGGNLVVTGKNGNSTTMVVTAGQVLPIRPVLIKSTGTTATGIVAIW